MEPMVCPRVPAEIAAFPSATGIETFKRQRISHLLQRWPECTSAMPRSQASTGPREASIPTHQEAYEQKRTDPGDRNCGRRQAGLREELYVPSHAEFEQISLSWDSRPTSASRPDHD